MNKIIVHPFFYVAALAIGSSLLLNLKTLQTLGAYLIGMAIWSLIFIYKTTFPK